MSKIIEFMNDFNHSAEDLHSQLKIAQKAFKTNLGVSIR
jgi:hypothetical protein